MIAVDSNILIYSHRSESPYHGTASGCVRRLAEGRSPWALPWPCIHEFLSVVTNRRVFTIPTPLDVALRQVDDWFESPSLALLTETSGHWTHLRTLLTDGQVAGPVVHDARIAAICLQHDVHEFWTADRDFSRFPGISVRNPLTPAGA